MRSEYRLTSQHAAVAILTATLVSSTAGAQVSKTSPTSPAASAKAASTAKPAEKAQPEGAKLVAALSALPAEKRKDARAVELTANAALGRSVSADGIFQVLFEYQRLVAKEAREDKALAEVSRVSSLSAKAAQLAEQNEAIDQGIREAGQKANWAMTVATTGMVIGIVQGLVQIGAAASGTSAASAQGVGRGSDFAVLAGVARAVENQLPPTTLAALNTHVSELLGATTKAIQSKGSVTAAYSSVFASDRALATGNRGKLLVLAAYLCHQKAMDDLKAAIEAGQARHADSPYEAALKRLRAALLVLGVLAPKLR